MSYSAITANNIKGISGTPLNGWVTFAGPVNGSGAPVSAVANGGPVMFETKKFLVANGVITGDDSSPQVPAQLVDSTTANPANIGYTVKFYDNVRGLIARTGYVCVQPSGASWSLDTYVPSQPAIATVTAGPDGLSTYAIWLAAGNSGTEDEFLQSQRGPGTADGVPISPTSVTLGADATAVSLVQSSDGTIKIADKDGFYSAFFDLLGVLQAKAINVASLAIATLLPSKITLGRPVAPSQ